MITPLVLIFLGFLCRVVDHPPNLVALGSICLFAGAKLPARLAWIVPIASMLLADFYLDWGTGRPAVTASRVAIYGAYVAIAFFGLLARRASGRSALVVMPALSLGASSLFFVASNFGVWLEGIIYPTDLGGLATCFRQAIPFFQNTILADLAGTLILFGFDALARRASGRHPGFARPRGDLVDA